MGLLQAEIGELERALNTLVYRPRLIRRDYWAVQIERLLERSGLTAHDRKRLRALRELLGGPDVMID